MISSVWLVRNNEISLKGWIGEEKRKDKKPTELEFNIKENKYDD